MWNWGGRKLLVADTDLYLIANKKLKPSVLQSQEMNLPTI